jgi:flagella basal body P-ring formation protein FlgA
MKSAVLLFLAVLFLATSVARGACVAVPSNKIRAQDLAAAVPAFQALDPEAFLAFAPFPGTQRVMSSHDLALIAHRYSLVLPGPDPIPGLCVERIVHPLALEEVTAALRSALDNPEARLEVLDFINQPVPPGRLEFRFAALNRPPPQAAQSNAAQSNDAQTPVIWPGKLIYDTGQSMAIWAKVRISVEREVWVAGRSIAKGDAITADEISTTRVAQFPATEFRALNVSALVGKIARRPIVAGQRILPEMLEESKDVRGGETVHVKVVAGAATITLDAVAQSSGVKGESVLIHNPSSGKAFRAVIDGPSSVIVTSSTASTLSRSSGPDPSPKL